MYGMFSGAMNFNQPLVQWNVSSVTTTWSMFWNATSFNQPLSSWDVVGVSLFLAMFQDASLFNQDISAWIPNGHAYNRQHSNQGFPLMLTIKFQKLIVCDEDMILCEFNPLLPTYTPVTGVGTLRLYEALPSKTTLLWSQTGSQGQQWIQHKIHVSSTQSYQVGLNSEEHLVLTSSVHWNNR